MLNISQADIRAHSEAFRLIFSSSCLSYGGRHLFVRPDHLTRRPTRPTLIHFSINLANQVNSLLESADMDEVDETPPLEVDPYGVLEVDTDATPNDVKTAYRKLALRHHPGTPIRHSATDHLY